MLDDKKILILDGAMGTMLQQSGANAPCNDALNLSNPELIASIHEQYIEAGANIISTNTFNSNAISLADYELADRAYDIAKAGAEIARRVADAAHGKEVIVAGSMGPTNRTLSLSPDVNDPAYREISYQELKQAYIDQARGLIDGGVDAILVETIFDTLNAKAAIDAIRSISADIPLMLSATVSDASGRTLSGQTVDAFFYSIRHAKAWSVGLNCGFGASHLLPYLRQLSAIADTRISVHPNAGLPNIAGEYDETPDSFAAQMEQYFQEGLVNVAGGCCGTTPAHIAAMAECAKRYAPRQSRKPIEATVVSGLQALVISPEANFVNIGERTNVAGSAKFARLIREGNYEEALTVARAQTEAGAQVIDVCMDDAMIDGPQAMSHFLKLMASDPEVAALPVMIDSSHWATLEAGLQCCQGKSIVNSISLKEGEETFLRRARAIHAYGAAAVVMLFDEKGQADTLQRKIEVAQRAYDLLVANGFPKEDIIIDPNILAVATGMPEHDRYAIDFIEATRWIKQNLPGAKVSGGVSNLSFAFRGNNSVRKAMHAAFLYHAISAGMDMAIVNPQMVQLYDDIPDELLQHVEDVVLYRRSDAADRLIALAQRIAETETPGAAPAPKVATAELTLEQRISQAMMRGDSAHIAEDSIAAYQKLGSAIEVINTLLMPAMEHVGQLFGQGKMFLPQVVKSARVMKQAVDALTPHMGQDSDASTKYNGTIVVATVKGDVHDIGKNIVSVVMACNGYKIHDLGVMVEPQEIVSKAKEYGAHAIGVSGLITPSLHQMVEVAREMDRQGLDIPLIIGGATTSAMHTAVKIAPETSALVIHSTDAAENVRILSHILGPDKQEYAAQVRAAQAALRQQWEEGKKAPATMRGASLQTKGNASALTAVLPDVEYFSPTIAELRPMINWKAFFAAWGVAGDHNIENPDNDKAREAQKLYVDAQKMLDQWEQSPIIKVEGVKGTIDAAEAAAIFGKIDCPCCAASHKGKVELFALTAGIGLDKLSQSCRDKGDEYQAIMAKFLADRLAEACAQWAFPTEEKRIAIGYPAAPDHALKRKVFALLQADERTGMRLSDSNMIIPGESICGYYSI